MVSIIPHLAFVFIAWLQLTKRRLHVMPFFPFCSTKYLLLNYNDRHFSVGACRGNDHVFVFLTSLRTEEWHHI